MPRCLARALSLISLTQCVIGLVLTGAATAHDVTRCGDLSNLVNQLDGAKMLALAGAAACLATLGVPGQALPRWLRVTALPLAVALVASGYAYLTLSQALAWTAYVSGTLLLVWVTGLGIALTVRQRQHGGASADNRPGRPRPPKITKIRHYSMLFLHRRKVFVTAVSFPAPR